MVVILVVVVVVVVLSLSVSVDYCGIVSDAAVVTYSCFSMSEDMITVGDDVTYHHLFCCLFHRH